MRRVIKMFAVLLVLSLVMIPVNVNTAYAADNQVVEINEENFPDDVFRQIMLDGYHYIWDENGNQIKVVYDANDDGWLSESEIANMKQLLIQEEPIIDLTGIEYLTSLIEIGCQYSAVEKMDLSSNKELLYLNCYHCGLTGEMDLTGNAELEGVACHNNRNLTGIDISGCANLDNLSCDNTGITELDISKNKKLRAVSFSATDIAELDTSNNPALEIISAYNTKLTSIDVSSNPLLQSMDVSLSQISSLDVSGNTALVDLNVENNPLAWLNIGNNPELNLISGDSNITLEVPEGSFDITEVIPGIDPAKVKIVSGAHLDGTTVSGYSAGTPIVYTYDCGVSRNGQATLKVTATLEVYGEDVPEEPSDCPYPPTEPEPPTATDPVETVPATGDNFSPVFWIVLLVAAGAVMVGLMRTRKSE